MPENTITFQAHIAEFSFELDLPNNLIFFSTFSWSLVTFLPLPANLGGMLLLSREDIHL